MATHRPVTYSFSITMATILASSQPSTTQGLLGAGTVLGVLLPTSHKGYDSSGD